MTQRIVGAQSVSKMCHVCGVENATGLHARFYNLENGEVAGVFTPRAEQQGYPGRLHGGLATTILDETIGRALAVTEPDVFSVTIELTVRFRKPVPLDGEIVAHGRVTKDSSRIFEGAGEILLPDGSVAVEAKGRFLRLPVDQIVDGEFGDQWFADERPLPDAIG